MISIFLKNSMEVITHQLDVSTSLCRADEDGQHEKPRSGSGEKTK